MCNRYTKQFVYQRLRNYTTVSDPLIFKNSTREMYFVFKKKCISITSRPSLAITIASRYDE